VFSFKLWFCVRRDRKEEAEMRKFLNRKPNKAVNIEITEYTGDVIVAFN